MSCVHGFEEDCAQCEAEIDRLPLRPLRCSDGAFHVFALNRPPKTPVCGRRAAPEPSQTDMTEEDGFCPQCAELVKNELEAIRTPARH